MKRCILGDKCDRMMQDWRRDTVIIRESGGAGGCIQWPGAFSLLPAAGSYRRLVHTAGADYTTDHSGRERRVLEPGSPRMPSPDCVQFKTRVPSTPLGPGMGWWARNLKIFKCGA